MGDTIKYKFVTIREGIDGSPKEGDFELIDASFSISSIEQSSNQVLVKCLQVSIDPYQLNRMKPYSPSQNSGFFAAKLLPKKAIDGAGVGRVVASSHPEFKKSDLVSGLLVWAEYALVDNTNVKFLRKLDPMGFPLSYHVGILGASGLTAYAGFYKVGKPKEGERVFVSAASGSVGNLVGQYAKLLGCYVVGSAGTTQKVALLKQRLGFDEAFNYKEETDLNLALKRSVLNSLPLLVFNVCSDGGAHSKQMHSRHFPDGIDIYFDNVGGKMLEAAIANMNPFGRVVVCGVISEYTTTDPATATGLDMINVIYKRITIQGFLANDFAEEFADFVSKTSEYLHAGQMQVLEDISFGLESIPSAFVGLFCGRNTGKTIVQIANDS